MSKATDFITDFISGHAQNKGKFSDKMKHKLVYFCCADSEVLVLQKFIKSIAHTRNRVTGCAELVKVASVGQALLDFLGNKDIDPKIRDNLNKIVEKGIPKEIKELLLFSAETEKEYLHDVANKYK